MASKEYYAEYRRNNKERLKEHHLAWRIRNREKINEYSKLYREANPDRCRKAVSDWSKANKVQKAANEAKRRALKAESDGSWSATDIANLLKHQHHKCIACLKDISKGFHVDHRVPLSKGGSNDFLNLDLLCPKCNLSKSNQDPLVFMRKKGWLL